MDHRNAASQGGQAMADHKTTEFVPGTMDIREQEKTFSGFLKFTSWVVVISLGALVFMALSNA
jgi:hypothetical protein